MQPLGRAFAHSQLRRAGIGPPFALRHLVARPRGIGPAQLRILQQPARKMLLFQLLHRLAVEREKPAGHHRHQIQGLAGRLAHSGLALKELFDARDLVG